MKRLATVDTPRLFQLSINLGNGSLLPRVGELGVDGTLLLFAIGVALIASVLFGLAPALDMSRTGYAHTISAGAASRSGTALPMQRRIRSVLVVAQVVMATTLLVGAGLLVHSFVRLLNVDPGYDTRDVLTFQLGVPAERPAAERVALIERVIARLEADGRVTSAAYTNVPPFLSITEYGGLFVPPGRTRDEMLDDPLRPQTRIVSHQFLHALGARLAEGRWFSANDGGSQPSVLVVNRSLARRYFGQQSPVGALVQIYKAPAYAETWQIVGVVDDMRQARLDQDPFPLIYVDMRQFVGARARVPQSVPQVGDGLPGFPTLIVRSAQWPALASEVRGLVRRLDSALSVESIASLEHLHTGSLVRPRFYATLLGLFAAMAAVLAAVGIYGVLAYSVVQRTQEIGVRMALGAQRGAVLGAVLRHGLMLTMTGIALGIGGAAALSRYLSGMLYGVTAVDAGTYAAIALGFALVAAIACYLPARRATKVDPIVALRFE